MTATASSPPDVVSAPAARAGLGIVVAIVLLALNLRTAFASLPPLLGDVRDDLGLSATAAGLLTTLPVVLLGVLAPLAPRIVRRVSIERLLVACAALTAAGCGLRGSGATAPLFAGALLAGGAIALAQAVLPVLIRSRFPAQTGMLTGAFSMSLTLGAAIAAGLAVPLQRALGGGWAPALAVWAIPAALAALLWLPAAAGRGTTVAGEAGGALRRSPLAWAVALYFGVQSMAFYAGLSWLPSILEASGRDEAQAGALQALGAIVQLPPAFVVPMLAARRASQGGLLALIVASGVAGLAGLLIAPGAAVAWMVLIGISQGGALGLGLILPALRGGGVAGVASLTSMMLCVGYLVASAGPWLLGAAHDLTGEWDTPLVVLMVITALQLAAGIPATRARTLDAR